MEFNEDTLEKLMQADINMREKIAELEKQVKEVEGQRAKVQEALHEACKQLKVSSLKTKIGTLSRTVRTTYATTDWPSLYKFIFEHNVPEFLHKRLSSTNIKEFLEQHPDLHPPGLNTMNEYTISIRKSKDKEQE